MKPERWVQIEELFNHAVECEPHQRFQLLERAGTTDPELRREVESLLSCYGSADAHLRAAVREEAGAIGLSVSSENREIAFLTRTILASEAFPGVVIGPYHLVGPIGQGGMGEVWLAEQKQPVRRRVVIKLIKAGMDTREVVARFESERQALALMDHPAIAKVFDAGSTSTGAAVLRHGVRTRYADHRLLRQTQADSARAAAAFHSGVRRGETCASKGNHPSRSETFERPGDGGGRARRYRGLSISEWPKRSRSGSRRTLWSRVRERCWAHRNT